MKIGVFGSAAGDISIEVAEKAREIGRQIAKRGHEIVTGACPGLPYEAVLGAKELGGKCTGFSPATSMEAHEKTEKLPTDGFSKIFFVEESFAHAQDILACRKYRNVLSIAYSDAGIIIGGRIGTMNEFTILYDLGKNIGVLEESGGITKNAIKVLLEEAGKASKSKIVYSADPKELVQKLSES